MSRDIQARGRISIFKTRSPQRDRDSDSQRLSRLTTMLRTMIDDMRAERDGLETRRHKYEEEAAFSMLAFEDGGGGRMSAKVNELTVSIVAATDRLKSLQDQIAFASRLLDETVVFGASTLHEPGRR